MKLRLMRKQFWKKRRAVKVEGIWWGTTSSTDVSEKLFQLWTGFISVLKWKILRELLERSVDI